jgi:hypothetical protein
MLTRVHPLRGPAALAGSILMAAFAWTGNAAAEPAPLTVGILPFDATNVDGWSGNAAQALAKLVRLELGKEKDVEPDLLEAGGPLPLSTQKAAAAGKAANADVVIAGTVLEASTTHGNNGGFLPGKFGASVGGNVNRTKATVSLHVDLVDPASNKIADSFDVEAHNTDLGVGGNVSTILGGFNVGDDAWDKTPLGKALREAAQKVTKEVMKRRGKFKRP